MVSSRSRCLALVAAACLPLGGCTFMTGAYRKPNPHPARGEPPCESSRTGPIIDIIAGGVIGLASLPPDNKQGKQRSDAAIGLGLTGGAVLAGVGIMGIMNVEACQRLQRPAPGPEEPSTPPPLVKDAYLESFTGWAPPGGDPWLAQGPTPAPGAPAATTPSPWAAPKDWGAPRPAAPAPTKPPAPASPEQPEAPAPPPPAPVIRPW